MKRRKDTGGDQAGRWVAMAGYRGGTVGAIAMSPSFATDRLAFAATNAGLFRSRDGGRSWECYGEGLDTPNVQSIAFSPAFAADRTLYVGAGDGRLFRSSDGGENWSFLARLGNASPVVALAIAQRRDGLLLAGTLADGVFRGTDGGQEWSPSNSGLSDLSVLALAPSPAFDSDGTAFVATATGLYRTGDGGGSWEKLEIGKAGEGLQCLVLSPNFAADRTLFIGTDRYGMLRSTDGGATWRQANRGLPDLSVNALALSPDSGNGRLLMAGTGRGIAASTDGGESWRPVGGETEVVLSLAISPADPATPAATSVVLAGLHNSGVLRSGNGGADWELASGGLAAASLVGLALSPGFERDGILFAWGLSEGVLRSEDGGRSWAPTSGGMEAGTVASVVVFPSFPDDGTLYAATSSGVWRSRNRAAEWESLGLEDQELALLALSPAFPRDSTMVATSSEELHLSTDGGASWKSLDPPAAGEQLVALAMGLNRAGERLLLAASWREPSEDRRGRVRVWMRTLPESPWRNVFYTDTGVKVTALTLPPTFHQDGRFFIANGTSVYRTVPGAKERTREGERPLWLPGGVRSGNYPVTSLAASPDFARDRTLLTAAGTGVHISRDEGLTWRRLGTGPGERPVVSVAPSPNYADDGGVFALTLGGQLWRWETAP